MSSLCCEPLVRAIISGMSVRGMNFEEYSGEQLSLIRKACRLALITRWRGEHHILFWKHEIGIVLLDLLKPEFPHYPLWCDDQRLASIFYTCNLLALRKYAWDVLGWLATHCKEGLDPEELGNQSCVDMLITSSWYCFIIKNTFSCCVYEKVLGYFADCLYTLAAPTLWVQLRKSVSLQVILLTTSTRRNSNF